MSKRLSVEEFEDNAELVECALQGGRYDMVHKQLETLGQAGMSEAGSGREGRAALPKGFEAGG